MFERFFSHPDEILFKAIKEGCIIKAQEAIKNGVNLKIRSYDLYREEDDWLRNHHLEHAIKRGRSEILALLLNAGANVNKTLFKAIKVKCESAIITVLLNAGAEVNVADQEGETPLFKAVKNGYGSAIITLFLNAGADVNKANCKGETPFFEAVKNGYRSAIITLFLNAGADVNKTNYEGETPLMMTVYRHSNIDIATLLLKNGALIDFIDNKGESALLHASKTGNLKILELLIEAGANTGLKNKEGRTAEMLADNNATRTHLVSFASERNNSLQGKLNEFENLRDQQLNKGYSSEKMAQKSATEISNVIWKSSANNARVLREHIDKLPIDFRDLRNCLFDWSDLLTILNSKELTIDEQNKFDNAARAIRELAAALGHQDAKRITARYKQDKDGNATQDEKEKSKPSSNKLNIASLTSSSMFSPKQKPAQTNQSVGSREIDNASSKTMGLRKSMSNSEN